MGSNRRAEDPIHPDDPDALSYPNHERSILLGSERMHSPLSQEEEDEDHAREVSSWKRLHWWKRPSPYWLIFGIPFDSVGYSALLAPRVAMYTALACRVHRPDYVTANLPSSLHSFGSTLAHSLMTMNAVDAPIPYDSDASETAVDMVPTLHLGSIYPPSSDYTQNGPDSEQKCASDPVVQALVARLNAVFATSMGILGCLTTGWWGSLSDRYGRRIVIFVSVFGLFVTEFTHVITAWFVDALPGGYWFPLVGFLIEGLCGSMPTGVAINHAYLADTTDPSTRSRYFSLSLGLMFTGVAVGPVLGGLLIRSTGTILSVFYFASILHGIYAIFILFILPESLTRARARGAHLRREQEKANQAPSGRALGVVKSIAKFFSPLVVLLPENSLNPLKRRERTWNLFFIAIAYGLNTSVMGSYPYKYQYTAAQFNWTPEITSYYISFIGATRAFFLAIVLPFFIKYLKAAPVQLASTPDEPLRGTSDHSPPRSATSLPGSAQTNTPEQQLPASRSPTFDLLLARASAGLDAAVFLGAAVASTGILFTLVNAIGSFAAGFPPATQALALDIYTNRRPQNRGEVGKLFGALSVLQALGSQVISPALYGFVYSRTVADFPQAFIVVSMCTSLLALIFVSFVRIPSTPAADRFVPRHGNEEGSQEDVATPEILLAMENEAFEGR